MTCIPPQVFEVILDQKVVLVGENQTVAQTASNSSLSARSRLSERVIVPDGSYSYQAVPNVPELNFISQPPGTYLEQMADYKFPATAGLGVDVYVPDSGVLTTNNEFLNMQGEYRWLQPLRGTWQSAEPWARSDPSGHGTCVASKIAGYSYGVAKNANLIILRMPSEEETDDVFNSGMLLAFQMMVADIVARKRAGYNKLPVVSISWGTANAKLSEGFKVLLFRAIRNLINQGTVLVMASGNGAVSWPLDPCHCLESL